MMDTIEHALAWAWTVLARASDSEPLDASTLLMYVLRVDRAALLTHPERELTPEQAAQYQALIERRAAGVPVPYLTGVRAFYGRDFLVTPDVLIPRPETEHLIESALQWTQTRERHTLRVVDVGTGSGAIAVTLAAHLPGARVWAVDISAAALGVARQNAVRHGVADRITFVQGDLLQPLIAADLIAANLPYIASDELDTLPVVKHEPRLALDGGADGLDLIRRLLEQAPRVLALNGLLLIEIAAGQGEHVCKLTESAFPGAQVQIIRDYAGHDRVVQISSS
jgi:release factor glutamine methyltransferase